MQAPQWLIALDQFFNCFVKPARDAWADETFSSRCWRNRADPRWERWRVRVDRLFKRLFKEDDHCRDSYVSEQLRRQLPPELRAQLYTNRNESA